MAVADEAVVSRLQDGAAANAVDNTDEPYALQSLCMSCYENVRHCIYRVRFVVLGPCLTNDCRLAHGIKSSRQAAPLLYERQAPGYYSDSYNQHKRTSFAFELLPEAFESTLLPCVKCLSADCQSPSGRDKDVAHQDSALQGGHGGVF